VGIEVKAAVTLRPEDARGLLRLREACGQRFVRGILLHDGNEMRPLGDRLQAVPVGMLAT